MVAGYAVETPRLLLMSATERFRDGLANSSGLVGKNLMTQPNQAVFGDVEEEIRWNKAPPSTTITEHWNYDDSKDFHGGYCWMAQGPLPIEWATVQVGARGLWGERSAATCRTTTTGRGEDGRRVHAAREQQGDARRREGPVRPADHPRHLLVGDNDKALIEHALDQMEQSMQAAGVRNLFRQDDDYQPPRRHRAHGRRPAHQRGRRGLPLLGLPNLWVCDGSVFPTVGGVNPSLTIQAVALRTADRIEAMARRGEL